MEPPGAAGRPLARPGDEDARRSRSTTAPSSSPTATPSAPAAAILRDVAVRVESAGKGRLAFEGTAKGDTFDRLSLKGTVDVATGRVELQGDLARLAISDPLRGRLPAELKPAVERLGLTGGEADLRIGRVAFDPAADAQAPLRRLGPAPRGGLELPQAPVPAQRPGRRVRGPRRRAHDRPGRGLLRRDDRPARPRHGSTSATPSAGRSTCALEVDRPEARRPAPRLDPARVPGRLEGVPPERPVEPGGQGRPRPRGGPGPAQDGGRLPRRGDALRALQVPARPRPRPARLGGGPGRRRGPPDARRRPAADGRAARSTTPARAPWSTLDFNGKALPIDKTLLDAMPPEVREVVNQFRPTGAVGGDLTRPTAGPPSRPATTPRGKVVIDA